MLSHLSRYKDHAEFGVESAASVLAYNSYSHVNEIFRVIRLTHRRDGTIDSGRQTALVHQRYGSEKLRSCFAFAG